jgi:hypothetical protein
MFAARRLRRGRSHEFALPAAKQPVPSGRDPLSKLTNSVGHR